MLSACMRNIDNRSGFSHKAESPLATFLLMRPHRRRRRYQDAPAAQRRARFALPVTE
jgi:hypothetical protein